MSSLVAKESLFLDISGSQTLLNNFHSTLK
jgi:hypothetical protein